MKNDLLLVLCFYEGQGFFPKERHSIVLSARIDGNTLSTDPVPQTSEPKFCTEVSWAVDHQTLRRYKLSRVPVRVECYSLDKHNERKCLGYIILTLSSVVQGIETDPKWHKVLGGNLIQSKVPPQLLLSLNLHPANPHAAKQIKADSPRMLHSGSMHGGQFTMGPAGGGVNNHVKQQNGTSHSYQDANMNSHMALSHSDAFQRGDVEAPNKLGALLSDRSQTLISSSQKDVFRMPPSDVENSGKVESGSSKCFEDEFSQSQHIDLGDDSDDDLCKIEAVYTEEADEDMSPHPASVRNAQQEVRVMNRFSAASTESVKERDFTNCNGQVEHRSKFMATSPVELVRSLLDGVTSGGESFNKNQTSGKQKENHDDVDIYAGMDDDGLDSGFQSRFGGKAQEGWTALPPFLHHSSGDIEQGIAGSNNGPQSMSQTKYENRRVSDPLMGSVVGDKQNYIPVKNVRGGVQSNIHSSAGRHSGGHADHLVPYMDHEGGFIQIGPAGDPEEESFEFSITILFAKNLEQLLPRDYSWSPNSGTCFSYSLMGSVITGDPIRNIYNPDFLAERVAGNIRATASNLSSYFKKNLEFPIHLLIGDLCLASTSISLAKFQDFDSRLITQIPVTLEGCYQLVSVVSESTEVVPGKEPVLGVILQLSGQSQRSSQRIPAAFSNSESSESEVELSEYPLHRRRRYREGKAKYRSSKFDTASMSSMSSEDDILPAGKKRRSTNPLKLHHKEKSLIGELHALRELSDEGKKLRRHLFKAALEVESWKEDQQAVFLKQWSAREAELQRHLSDEWRSRINSIESNLHSRLGQSDTLNRKLTAALSELSIREKKLSVKEERVRKLLGDLEIQKHEQEDVEKGTFEGRLKQTERRENDALLEELTKEKEKREQLENEVCELKSTLAQVEMPPHLQHHDMKKQIFSLKREKVLLSEELGTAMKKKQYYKVQWVRSVSELHHLKKSHLYDVETLRSEMEASSPEPFYVHPQHHHRRHRPRSHTIDGGARRAKRMPSSRKSGKVPETFSARVLESQRLNESVNVEPGCSWMDQPSSRETRSRVEPRMSGMMHRNRTEPERTIEMGKGRRTSIGNASEFEEFIRGKSNEEPFEKLLKENNVWKMGEK